MVINLPPHCQAKLKEAQERLRQENRPPQYCHKCNEGIEVSFHITATRDGKPIALEEAEVNEIFLHEDAACPKCGALH
jgi:hypothetical protein